MPLSIGILPTSFHRLLQVDSVSVGLRCGVNVRQARTKKRPRRQPGPLVFQRGSCYQVRQPPEAGIIGCPTLQPNALPNSSKFCTVPLTRHSPEECGSVLASTRADCSVAFWHHTWPERNEEALCRCVAVRFAVHVQRLGHFAGLGQRHHQRLVGDADAAVVGGVFAQRQVAVQVLPRSDLEAVVFLGGALGALLELGQVVGGKPVHHWVAHCRGGRTAIPGRRSRASSRGR